MTEEIPKRMPTSTPTGHFLPPCRYYGDRFPRTLEEAFGCGARLDVDRRTWMQKNRAPLIFASAAALAVASAFFLM